MSIIINSVKADNFISLGSAELDFSNGVYLVKGENKDVCATTGDTISNGAGKTTLFSAVYQGLYNKNSKDSKATIGDTNNLYTGKPYKITVDFSIGNINYLVINDREANKITIKKDGEDISPKGITNQLALLKDIIGFDFQTFSSLTFLNSDSLKNIIDLTNKDNIVYQFFDIEALNNLEKSIKKRKKELETTLDIILNKVHTYEKQLSVMEISSDYDLQTLYKDRDRLNNQLSEVELKLNSQDIVNLEKLSDVLDKGIVTKSKELSVLKADGIRLKVELDKLSSGCCPTCGQTFDGDTKNIEKSLSDTRELYANTKKELDTLQNELDRIRKELSTIKGELESKLSTYREELHKINYKISAEEALEEQRNNISKVKDDLQKELDELKKELPTIESDIKVHTYILSSLKSGAVVNEYLNNYKKLLLVNFNELRKYTSFDIDIKVKVSKGKMAYTFVDGGKDKSFTMLSAGERTRVSLMLLLATLKTIEQLTGTSVNYLVLDELLGVLDKEGVEFLKNVLVGMKQEKSIFIITHHGEIEDTFADKIIKVVKENNISRVEYA